MQSKFSAQRTAEYNCIHNNKTKNSRTTSHLLYNIENGGTTFPSEKVSIETCLRIKMNLFKLTSKALKSRGSDSW